MLFETTIISVTPQDVAFSSNNYAFFSPVLCVCRTNSDDLMGLDIAVVLGHFSIAKMLLARGAKDSARCESLPVTVHHRSGGTSWAFTD